jgi:hypothetical protein
VDKIASGGDVNKNYSDVGDVDRDHCAVDKIALEDGKIGNREHCVN